MTVNVPVLIPLSGAVFRTNGNLVSFVRYASSGWVVGMRHLVERWRSDADNLSRWGESGAAKVLHQCADDLEAVLVTVGDESGEWVTPTEIAQILRVDRTTVYALIKKHEIPHVRVGRTIRIRRDALNDVLSRAA